MGEPNSSDATRARLQEELDRVREQRRGMASRLTGEDADDPDRGDTGDDAVQLEGLDDLARTDARIAELERLIAGPDTGLADGTEVTLRFPDGDVATLRVVAITEEASADDQDDVVTVDSPLGRALVGRRAGDTVTYTGPDGELQAEVVAVSGGG